MWRAGHISGPPAHWIGCHGTPFSVYFKEIVYFETPSTVSELKTKSTEVVASTDEDTFEKRLQKDGKSLCFVLNEEDGHLGGFPNLKNPSFTANNKHKSAP